MFFLLCLPSLIDSPSYDEKDGLFTATLELSLQLSRDDLGHSIECRAESAAIKNTIKNHFSVDLQGKFYYILNEI